VVLLERKRGPFRAAVLPLSVEYVTPLVAPTPEGATALEGLMSRVGRSVHQATFVLHPTLADPAPFERAGFGVTQEWIAEMPIPAEGPVEAGWRRSAQKLVRRHGEAYRIEDDPRHAEAAVALAGFALDRKGLGPLPHAPLRAMAARLVASGEVSALAALAPGSEAPEGAVLYVPGAPTAHLWLMGSRPGPAMTVLLAVLAARLREEGTQRLYLGGANVPEVAAFKLGFGGARIAQLRARWAGHPLLRALGRLRR